MYSVIKEHCFVNETKKYFYPDEAWIMAIKCLMILRRILILVIPQLGD